MDHQETSVEKEGVADSGLIDLVFSWSMEDVLNRNLYKNKVTEIPDTFSTVTSYMKTFIPSLVEETHADLLSSMKTLPQAPTCEILAVTPKRHKNAKDFSYVIIIRGSGEAENYEPQTGDLIALTDIRPTCSDHLNRLGDSYLIAYVRPGRDNRLFIRSSKPISRGGGRKLFAVFLINMTTNVRIWKALISEKANTNIIKNVLQVQPNSSQGGNSCSICFSKEKCSAAVSNRWPSMGSDLNDSQKAAVLNCINLSKCTHQNTIKLIWGPPGTGKTKTVAMSLLALSKLKCRTLTCAPTNVALLEVTARLLGLINQSLDNGKYGLGDIILFGNGERMKIDNYDDLVEVFLDYRIEILAQCFNPGTGWKHWLESMIGLLEDPQQKYSTRDDENDFQTFEEFVKEKLNSVGEHVEFCMVNLYTHLPTSCISLEVVTDMIGALDLLNSLKSLLREISTLARYCPLWAGASRYEDSEVCFTNEFQNSIQKIKDTEIHREVVSLLTKLANGWRQSLKNKITIVHGTCAQVLQKYKVKGLLNLIWSVDVLQENSDYVQVLKIWDVLPVSDTPELDKRLENMFRSYTTAEMNLCLLRCVDGDAVVPIRMLVDSSSSHEAEADPVQVLSKPLSSLSLKDKPQTSSSEPQSHRKTRNNMPRRQRK
ncbi:hypothetical protein L3X38_004087 [Prunus dulcis]|uniref:P-loop containing nucleoside triphosphate hydrolases superfamily protein n=1 Tax=Prunus dulcis TaxID=3755 RepID=A0AAD5F2T2_PRUDU|nr:hypothetical protein L3X38_004087 [Prunus dulcis]